jgi:hypothetical protein
LKKIKTNRFQLFTEFRINSTIFLTVPIFTIISTSFHKLAAPHSSRTAVPGVPPSTAPSRSPARCCLLSSRRRLSRSKRTLEAPEVRGPRRAAVGWDARRSRLPQSHHIPPSPMDASPGEAAAAHSQVRWTLRPPPLLCSPTLASPPVSIPLRCSTHRSSRSLTPLLMFLQEHGWSLYSLSLPSRASPLCYHSGIFAFPWCVVFGSVACADALCGVVFVFVRGAGHQELVLKLRVWIAGGFGAGCSPRCPHRKGDPRTIRVFFLFPYIRILLGPKSCDLCFLISSWPRICTNLLIWPDCIFRTLCTSILFFLEMMALLWGRIVWMVSQRTNFLTEWIWFRLMIM